MTSYAIAQNINLQTVIAALWAAACLVVGVWLVARWAALPAVGFALAAVIPLAFWLCLAGLAVGAYVSYPRGK